MLQLQVHYSKKEYDSLKRDDFSPSITQVRCSINMVLRPVFEDRLFVATDRPTAGGVTKSEKCEL